VVAALATGVEGFCLKTACVQETLGTLSLPNRELLLGSLQSWEGEGGEEEEWHHPLQLHRFLDHTASGWGTTLYF